jgi:TRAP-type C4-dicarboxylate transport system permease small subunit
VIQGISLVVLIGIEVFFRYILQNSLSWPEEVAGISFVWFTLLGVAIGLQEDSHISFDLITKHSPPLLRKIILIFAHLMAIVYAWFMIRYGTAYALMFSFETTPAAQINTLWLNFSLPVSGGFIIIFAVFKIITIMNLTKKEIEEFS